jgi:hypothetical protein
LTSRTAGAAGSGPPTSACAGTRTAGARTAASSATAACSCSTAALRIGRRNRHNQGHQHATNDHLLFHVYFPFLSQIELLILSSPPLAFPVGFFT